MIRIPRIKKWIIYLLATFFVAETITGSLRYYLSQAGYSELIYLPKVLLSIGVIIYLINKIFVERRANLAYLVIMAVMAWGVLYGYYQIENLRQVAFGIWSFVPLLAGVFLGYEVNHRWPDWKFFIAFLWGILVFGVILNYFVSYPWEGTIYSLGGIEFRSARLWFGHGFKRLAGLGRSSSITANQLLIFSVLLLGLIKKQKSKSFIIWALSSIAIILTTNKTAILIIIFVGVFWFFWKTSPQFGRFLLKISILGTGLTLIILPIFSVLNNYGSQFTKTQSILNSFNMRLSLVWPGVIELIAEQGGNPFFGIGVGGVGAAQKYFNPGFQNVTDNISLFLYASFGIIGLILVIFCVLASLSNGFKNQISYTVGILTFVIFTIGITSNVIQSPFTSFVFGVIVWRSFRVNKIRNFKSHHRRYFRGPNLLESESHIGS